MELLATAEFRLGDLVRMKWGGPWMVVAAVRQDGRIECIPDDSEDKHERRSVFLPSMIERATNISEPRT